MKRTAITRSVSLDPTVAQRLDARLAQLKPRVKGFSHYVQLLIEMEMARGTNEQTASVLSDWCATATPTRNNRPVHPAGTGSFKPRAPSADMLTHALSALSDLHASQPGATNPLVCAFA